ncbi:hypothetical protein PR202_ga20901 [Eleusine coracana subsp. coracana]|uniref:F-box domain-containing protein n=1 Tax=Eleusine coracana subsp. coracana TaxID=191504 RepID=A0AAV5CZ92_ELECO|nr:hypothetical protein PR202_ga20901 [Eleusine coracana subsp. coracana]
MSSDKSDDPEWQRRPAPRSPISSARCTPYHPGSCLVPESLAASSSCSAKASVMVNHLAVASRHGRVMPPDVLFDILLRLPAKDICRFRAVCRHWLSLTSEPLFIDARIARQQGPLIVASFHGDGKHVHLMDSSGRVVKRVPSMEGLALVRSRLDLVCVADMEGNCSVIDPVTGAVSHLPNTPPELDWWGNIPVTKDDSVFNAFLLGRVDSTGDCKVLRLSRVERERTYHLISCVLTLDDADGVQRWRPTGRPEFIVNTHSGVVVGDAVYYFWWTAMYPDPEQDQWDLIRKNGDVPDCIARFDLEAEKWTTISGPCLLDGQDVWTEYFSMLSKSSTLAELRGNLVLAHNFSSRSLLDLWFLIDTESCLWVKEYSIWTEQVIPSFMRIVKPLLLLDDGRILIFLGHRPGALFLYDPSNVVFSRLDTAYVDEVGLYTGRVLSLQSAIKVQ